MGPAIEVRTVPVIDAEVWLRADRFDLMTSFLGCETERSRAEMIDMSERQLLRARSSRVGEVLIAKTLAGLGRHEKTLRRGGLPPTFEDLFEIRQPGRAA